MIDEYAMEGGRKVKGQLNKHKPDKEYEKINIQYVNKDGETVIVYYPESKYSSATQNPRRKADNRCTQCFTLIMNL